MLIKKLLSTEIVLLLLVACAASIHSGDPKQELKTNRFYFFPKGSFGANSDDDEFYRNSYSKSLKVMKEPSISNPEVKFESAYRFLWIRSFHHAISVRIIKSNGSLNLTAIELNGQGSEPGKIKRSIRKQILIKEYEKFCNLLTDIDFWSMGNKQAITNNPDGTIDIGTDGANWVIEGFNNGKYHVVSQWSPESGKFKELCLYLLDLSGLKAEIKPEEIY